MNSYLGGCTLGLLLAFLALGLVVTYRVLRTLDLTVEGSFALGGCLAASLITNGWHPVPATATAIAAGAAAGLVTGSLIHALRVPALLAGILTATALLSGNVLIMGQGNLPLLSDETPTLITFTGQLGEHLNGGELFLGSGWWKLNTGDLATAAAALTTIAATIGALAWFFGTHLGLALRATGDNPQMATALGVRPWTVQLLGLAIGNGLAATAGAFLVQYYGFADYRAGVGMLVAGFAALLLGEALLGRRGMGLARHLAAAAGGAILFRLLVVAALSRWTIGSLEIRLPANALNLLTAVLVLGALTLPTWWRDRRQSRPATP